MYVTHVYVESWPKMQKSHQRLCSACTQAANRVNFNQPEEEFLDGDDVVGLGVLGKEGSGQLRAQVTPTIPAILEITKADTMSLQKEFHRCSVLVFLARIMERRKGSNLFLYSWQICARDRQEGTSCTQAAAVSEGGLCIGILLLSGM